MFHVHLRGEDGTLFTRECEAKDVAGAMEWAEELWPEATVLEVFCPRERAQVAYERAEAMYDDPDLDDYDY